jgi:hypothetical protein
MGVRLPTVEVTARLTCIPYSGRAVHSVKLLSLQKPHVGMAWLYHLDIFWMDQNQDPSL